MKALLDTNIFLEVILAQEKSDDAKALLRKSAEHEFFVTDYSLHSIGLLLFRRKQHVAFQAFIEDVLYSGGINLLILQPDDMVQVIAASQKFALDFDDAYQYAVARKYELTIVTFDADFQRTDKECKTPYQFLQNS